MHRQYNMIEMKHLYKHAFPQFTPHDSRAQTHTYTHIQMCTFLYVYSSKIIASRVETIYIADIKLQIQIYTKLVQRNLLAYWLFVCTRVWSTVHR